MWLIVAVYTLLYIIEVNFKIVLIISIMILKKLPKWSLNTCAIYKDVTRAICSGNWVISFILFSLGATDNTRAVQNGFSAIARNLKLNIIQCRSDLSISVWNEGCQGACGRSAVSGVENISNISAPVANVAIFMDCYTIPFVSF